MRRAASLLIVAFLMAYGVLATILYEPYFVLAAFPFLCVRWRVGPSRFWSLHNWHYGAYIMRLLWPVVRVRRVGFERIPNDRPVVCVANHRSFFDIFFFGFVPHPRLICLVRSWPFRLPVYGIFMKLADYIDIEKQPIEKVIDHAARLAARGCAFVGFPEGHRSRDGRLQHFQSGMFRMAETLNLPVVAVVIEGSEGFRECGRRLARPVRVRMRMLGTVEPDRFPPKNRAQKMRREVERMFREAIDQAA